MRLSVFSVVVVVAVGCSDSARDHEPVPARSFDAAPTAVMDATLRDARSRTAQPATLEEALAALRGRGFGGAADAIARRGAQTKPKFKLTRAEGLACARYLLEVDSAAIRALHEVMPRSTVELVRATHERGVPAAEADRIAAFLVGYVAEKNFSRLDNFDRNHAHVTGRSFPEIDYSGEGMTWRKQKAYWSGRGVPDFKTAAHIRAYMRQAESMPHFERVYRPR